MNYASMMGGLLSFKDAVLIDLKMQAIAPGLSTEQRQQIVEIFSSDFCEEVSSLEWKLEEEESRMSSRIDDLEDENGILTLKVQKLEKALAALLPVYAVLPENAEPENAEEK